MAQCKDGLDMYGRVMHRHCVEVDRTKEFLSFLIHALYVLQRGHKCFVPTSQETCCMKKFGDPGDFSLLRKIKIT